MKNLELYDLNRIEIVGGLVEATDVLFTGDYIYAVINGLVCKYDNNGFHKAHVSTEYNCVTELTYLALEDKICFGTGSVFVFYTPKEDSIEVVSCPVEYCAATWSPQQEFLVVVTLDGQVFTYTFNHTSRLLKCLGQSHIMNEVVESSTVGWGSRETQFRGSEGRLATAEKEVSVREVMDRESRIVWCPDQKLFLVNYWIEGKRMFKIFDRTCTPLHCCEDRPGLQAVTAWKIGGNMIACAVHTVNWKIMIFEQNGLARSTFDLYNSIQVKDVKWSSNGEVLAVHQQGEKECYLSFYTTKNHHWYLKQRLDFKCDNELTSLKWIDSSDHICELMVSTKREILNYKFTCKIHRCPLENDVNGTCIVVDGNKLLVNYFAEKILSPPNAFLTCEVDTPISHVIFHPSLLEVLVIDSKYHCYIFSFEDKTFSLTMHRVLDIPPEFHQYPSNVHHFAWATDKMLYAVALNNVCEEYDYAFIFDSELELSSRQISDSKICHIHFLDKVQSFVKVVGGRAVMFLEARQEFVTDMIVMVDLISIPNEIYLLSLHHTNQFYVNNTCVAHNITSYLICDNYLFLTTRVRLYCIRLIAEELNEVFVNSSIEYCFWREIEEGGYLVCGIPRCNGILMQLPRGNLEVTNCRLVAIDKVEGLLRLGQWAEGFQLIRFEKLNSNLLVDLNPDRFYRDIGDFLLAIKSNDSITNFILDLRDEDVLETKYRNCKIASYSDCEQKKKKVCEAIIDYIGTSDVLGHIKVLMIAATEVDDICRVMDYLQQIFRSKTSESIDGVLAGLECLKLHYPYEQVCSTALQLYDLDFAEFVYEHSPGDPLLYKAMFQNFRSCASEEEKCYKINDFLENYKEALSFLARYISAELAEAATYTDNSLDPLTEYAKKHHLMPELYDIAISMRLFRTEISVVYASYLHRKSWHKEAGLVYACANLWTEALEEYKLCNEWQDAMFALERIQATDVQKSLQVIEIARNLEQIDKYKDAAFLYEVYLKECELAVSALVNGKLYTDALRVADKFNRRDLIETTIEPPFLEFVNNIFEKLKSSHALFTKYRNRLITIRKEHVKLFADVKKATDAASATNSTHDASTAPRTTAATIAAGPSTALTTQRIAEAMGGLSIGTATAAGDATAEPSCSSSIFASSVTRSIRSRSSATSARSRRKERLRMQDTREGGPYENIALMRFIHMLIVEIFSLNSEVNELCHLLQLFENHKMSKDLRNTLENIHTDMTRSFSVIWPNDLNSFSVTTPELLALRHNLECLDMVYRFPPPLSPRSRNE